MKKKLRNFAASAAAVAWALAAGTAGAAPLPSADFPVPDGASEVDRNDDIEMITFRTSLDAAGVKGFYTKALAQKGWTIDEEDSFLIEDIGTLVFANDDDAFQVTIQNGQPSSTSRIVVMGEGVAWASAQREEWEQLTGEEESPETGPLAASASYELPVPDDCESVGESGTPFWTMVDARIRRPLDDVIAFYRRELLERGYATIENEREVEGESLAFDATGTSGRVQVQLRTKRKDTIIRLETRDVEAAKQAGVLPEPGTARLLLGNAHDADAAILVDGAEKKVAAGTGAADPSLALALTVEPGAHDVTVKVAGSADQSESIQVADGEAWAVMVLSDDLYLAERVY